MKRPKAFTLRDMVAVVCLIGLALPVLAASLQGVLNKSQLARCMLNLSALTRAVNIYADRNRGYMPPYQHKLDVGSPRAPDNPYKTYVVFMQSAIDPNTGVFSDARGLGILYAKKYVRQPELFYCPVVSKTDPRMTLAWYPAPWGTAVGSGSNYIRNSYMWNPWIKTNPLSAGNKTYEDRLMLRQHPFYRPLMCDLVDDWANMTHFTADSAVWNMAYPAGQVVPFTNRTLYDWFKNQHWDESQNWGSAPGTGYNGIIRPLLPGANIPGNLK
jgi:type II secretory pathway pseudopilin PulG